MTALATDYWAPGTSLPAMLFGVPEFFSVKWSTLSANEAIGTGVLVNADTWTWRYRTYRGPVNASALIRADQSARIGFGAR